MYKILFLIIFVCWSVEASQHPVITDLKSTQCPGCQIFLTYQQKLAEMGGMVDQIVDGGHRLVTIGTKQINKTINGTSHEYAYTTNLGTKIVANTDETYAEAAVRLYTDVPSAQLNTATLLDNQTSSCIAYAFVPSVSGNVPGADVISLGGCIPVSSGYV